MKNKEEIGEKHYYARKNTLFAIILFGILFFISFFLLNDLTFIHLICIVSIVIFLIRYYVSIVVIGRDYIKIKGDILAKSKYILFNEITSWNQRHNIIEIYYKSADSEEEKKSVLQIKNMEEQEKALFLEELNKIYAI